MGVEDLPVPVPRPREATMVTCDYCKTSNQRATNCINCGGPLPPPPAVRVVSRTYDISRDMIDVTTFADTERQFMPGRRTALLTETTEEALPARRPDRVRR